MIVLDESQRAAVALAVAEPISIVTGGPGTGKSTIVSAMLDALDGKSVALAAPTGKAAKRLEETTGRPASTIHRLLKYNPAERRFFHNLSEPLPHRVIVIDEASMIDTALMASLLEAINPRYTRLVLVGDADQLPSVGPGAILRDLVNDSPVPCARLTTVHRSKAESWICNAAPLVLAGEPFDLEERVDFRFVEVDEAPNVPKHVGDVLEDIDAQVLVPQNTGKAGAEAINLALQDRFNPIRPGEKTRGREPHTLRPRDRVIHVRNNYELGVFNGEVGSVVEIDDDNLFVQYPDRNGVVQYTKSDARDLRLAYALTVHKSQGSEWPWVVVVVHNTHSYMLTRQLVYTAITRGKTGVVIVGNERGIEHALQAKRNAPRNTALCDRIRGTL